MSHLAVNVLVVVLCIATIAMILVDSFIGLSSLLILEPQFATSGEILILSILGTMVGLLVLAVKGRA